VIEQISLSVSLPGVDVPDGAVLCLANAEFTGCAPLLPSPVASAHPALLLQATGTYVATFANIPEGTYALTIPPIGSFAGYRGTITIDRDMPAVIAIDLPVPPRAPGLPSIPGAPGAPALPDEPELPGRRLATQTADAPVPASGVDDGPGAAPPPMPGDGTSGAGTVVDPGRTTAQAAGVTALPETGTGRTTAPGIIPLGTLTALSMLVLLWAIRAGSRARNSSSSSPGNDD